MECTLSGGYHDDDWVVLRNKMFNAKKIHKCGECGRPIEKGENYERCNMVCDGSFFWAKTCVDCISIRESFYPFGGYTFENVLDSIGEHIVYELHGEVDEKCIIPLTKKAKDVVFKLIEEGWSNELG